MEVHHHSHTSRKKWTHYFWEFLMLFFAVTLGFLVENQREHYVEHQRAKAYAYNLHEDLKRDTLALNGLFERLGYISGRLDTLCMFIKESTGKTITNGMLYYYGKLVTNVEYFSPNNTTIEQLKGSGNLRIMGNKIAYKISEYEKINRELEKEYGISKTEFAKLEDLHFRIFDVYYLEKMFPENFEPPRDSVFQLTDLPIRRDTGLMKEYIGWVKFEANIYRYQINRYLSALKRSATELLENLKKEYHLK